MFILIGMIIWVISLAIGIKLLVAGFPPQARVFICVVGFTMLLISVLAQTIIYKETFLQAILAPIEFVERIDTLAPISNLLSAFLGVFIVASIGMAFVVCLSKPPPDVPKVGLLVDWKLTCHEARGLATYHVRAIKSGPFSARLTIGRADEKAQVAPLDKEQGAAADKDRMAALQLLYSLGEFKRLSSMKVTLLETEFDEPIAMFKSGLGPADVATPLKTRDSATIEIFV